MYLLASNSRNFSYVFRTFVQATYKGSPTKRVGVKGNASAGRFFTNDTLSGETCENGRVAQHYKGKLTYIRNIFYHII